VIKLGDWLAAEPFGLALSSGFFGFFAHAGVMLGLERAGLPPSWLRGSSAGALVGGLWAAGLEGPDLRDELLRLRRSDFWDPAPGMGLLRGARFGRRLSALLPVSRFADCRVPLAVSVFDLFARGTRSIDRGALAPAVQASCTFPGLFQPLRLDGRPHLDGGILDRPGLLGALPGERLLHHHLASRSPWRRAHSPALAPPRRQGLVALVLSDLPRSGPFKLDAGRRALEQAEQATRRALDLPLGDVVEVSTRGPRPLKTAPSDG